VGFLKDSDGVERLRNTPHVEDIDFAADVWVGRDGLPARLALEASPRDQSGRLKITSDVLDYDVPIKAEPPIFRIRTLGGAS
jgi:hypothetical protein